MSKITKKIERLTKEAERPQFEYQVINYDMWTNETFESWLNRRGIEGWELVSAHYNPGEIDCVFKRVKVIVR